MAKAFDKYNRSIRAGDAITYPVRKGSAMWLADGRVTAVNADGSLSVQKADTGRMTTVVNTDTTVLASNSVRAQINSQIRNLA